MLIAGKDLYHLLEEYNISRRGVNICRDLGLNSIDDVISYYRNNETFMKGRNCGVKTNQELTRFAEIISSSINGNEPNSIDENDTCSVSTKKLYNTYAITQSALTICEKEGLENTSDIVKYYLLHGTFKHIVSCGDNTNHELMDLAKYYLPSFLKGKEISVLIEDDILVRVTNLLLESDFLKLSVRSKNCLEKMGCADNPNIKSYYTVFVLQEKSIEKVYNAGRKTKNDIEDFLCIAFGQLIRNSSSALSDNQLLLIQLEKAIGVNLSNDDFLKKRIKEKTFPVAYFLQTYLNQMNIFNEIELILFKNNFWTQSQNKKMSLLEIGNKFSFTRERARQIRKKTISSLSERFSFLSLIDGYHSYYRLFQDEIVVRVDEEFAQLINDDENSRLTPELMAFMLSVILKEEFFLVTKHQKIKLPPYKYKVDYFNQNKTLKHSYLVRKNVVDSKLIQNALNKSFAILCGKIKEDKIINLEQLLGRELTDNAILVLNVILRDQFNLLCIESMIKFDRNTPIRIDECIYDVLHYNNEPMHASEIYNQVVERFPELKKVKISSIQSTAIREKEKFISFGRTSTYGLKEWEETKENIRGGTIRDIVQEYLNKYDTPQHIDHITDYVNNFRDTTGTNILTNLKMEVGNTFTFYRGGYVGLSSINYKEFNAKF